MLKLIKPFFLHNEKLCILPHACCHSLTWLPEKLFWKLLKRWYEKTIYLEQQHFLPHFRLHYYYYYFNITATLNVRWQNTSLTSAIFVLHQNLLLTIFWMIKGVAFWYTSERTFLKYWLCEKWPNTEFFLVLVFPYSDWIGEIKDQKKLIWTLFKQ